MSDIYEMENRAEALKEEGKHKEAIEIYHEIIKVDDSFDRAHMALAVLYHLTGDHQKSVEHGEKAVEIAPNDPMNNAALSVTYQRAFEATGDQSFIEKAEYRLGRGQGHH